MNVKLLTENGVDVEKGVELLGDINTYNDMLNDFLTEAADKINNLNNYKEQKDMDNYSILVHSLKSDSKYFGFTKLADISYQHEVESKNKNIDYITNKYEELNAEVNRILKLVREYLEQN